MKKNNKKTSPLPHQDLVIEIITKEKALKDLFLKLKISISNSALDVSYCSEVLTILGLPDEDDLQENHKQDWDKYIDNYTAMIWGDISISEGLNFYRKNLAKVGTTYFPKKHTKMIINFFQKEKELFTTVKTLGGLESGPLSQMVNNWKLALALLGQTESDNLSQDLYKVIEKNGKAADLVKKWVRPDSQ